MEKCLKVTIILGLVPIEANGETLVRKHQASLDFATDGMEHQSIQQRNMEVDASGNVESSKRSADLTQQLSLSSARKKMEIDAAGNVEILDHSPSLVRKSMKTDGDVEISYRSADSTHVQSPVVVQTIMEVGATGNVESSEHSVDSTHHLSAGLVQKSMKGDGDAEISDRAVESTHQLFPDLVQKSMAIDTVGNVEGLPRKSRKSEVLGQVPADGSVEEFDDLAVKFQEADDQIADWSGSFDHKGWSKVDGLINGIYRNNCHDLFCIEQVKYAPVASDTLECYNENWWGSFDHKGWSTCKEGYYMSGIYRNSCNSLYCIEEVQCCKTKGAPETYPGGCDDANWWASFDHKGWSTCDKDNSMITGIWRNDCNLLHCIEKVKCCPFSHQICNFDDPDGINGFTCAQVKGAGYCSQYQSFREACQSSCHEEIGCRAMPTRRRRRRTRRRRAPACADVFNSCANYVSRGYCSGVWANWMIRFCYRSCRYCMDGNFVMENAPGVGGWGGSCTCPDGQVYQAGDNNNHCASLACIDGTSGTCNQENGTWSYRKVQCAA